MAWPLVFRQAGWRGADAVDEVFAGSDAKLVEDVPEVDSPVVTLTYSSAAVCRLERAAATSRATACSAAVGPGSVAAVCVPAGTPAAASSRSQIST
jgi:hypothetical protein